MAITNTALAIMGWELPTLQQLPLAELDATEGAMVALGGWPTGGSAAEPDHTARQPPNPAHIVRRFWPRQAPRR